MVIISLFIPALSFILQSYPRIFNRYFGVDVWTRLLEIDHVKRSGHKIPGKIAKGFIIEGNFDYPIIFPWLFSFVPKKRLLMLQGFVSPFFDALQNILVYIICFSLTNSIGISLLAQLIYSLIPMIPIENSYLTPRSLGYLMFTLAFYPLLLFQTTNILAYIFISLIFTTVLFLTHRFALQAFIFICIFFAIINASFIYLLVPVLSFFLATLLTRGYYLRVAKGHLYNIYFWTKNYKLRFSHQIYGLKSKKKLDWVGTIYLLLSQFSPIFLLITDVWVISSFIFFYFFIAGYSTPMQNGLIYLMSIWVIFFYVVGAIILRVKILIPIGEGQRYLEMATVPSSILSAILVFYFYSIIPSATIIVLVLLIFGNLSVILFVQIKGIIKDKNRSLTSDLRDLFLFINSLPKTSRIMCIPHQITTMTVYHTHASILVNADNKGLMSITDFYPTLKKPIRQIQKEYKLDYLILKQSFAKLSDLNLGKVKIVYKSNDLLLIKL